MNTTNLALRRLPSGLWVAFGGGLGAVGRFYAGAWLVTLSPAPFPWATFLINITGSTLLGFFMRSLPPAAAGPGTRAFLTIGFCGGFTTFSAFDLEVLTLIGAAHYAAASLYAGVSVLSCMAGVWLGFVGAALVSRRA